MRHILLLILLGCCFIGNGQVIDNFSDGDISKNPVWSGDIAKFTVENEKLRSNSGNSNDIFYISTPNTWATDCQWDFLINMQFGTSSANYTDVVLMCDSSDPSRATGGYFLRVGNTKDELAFYKMSNGSSVLLGDGTDGKTENKNIRIRVIRSDIGHWQILADYTGGYNFTTEITSTDNEITTGTHFSIMIRQSTASFFNKHFFDDIRIGTIARDSISPYITSLEIVSKNQLKLVFSEPIQKPRTPDFSLNKGIGVPATVDSINLNSYTLTFSSNFGSELYSLSVANIKDLAENRLDTIIPFQHYATEEPIFGDIFINEIFADPSPSVGMPDEEFAEIYNSSNKYIQLAGCTFSDGGTPAILPTFLIYPREYVVICKNAQEVYKNVSSKILAISNFPALNNTGDALVIKNALGQIIDSVTYAENWYKDDIKKQGGYSLERIDFVTNCSQESNWIASMDALGASPGNQNSVYANNPDKEAPKVVAFSISSSQITLELSEALTAALASDLNNFWLENSNENPISIAVFNQGKYLELRFNSTFEQNKAYLLHIKKLADCVGNTTQDTVLKIFFYATDIVSDDLIINELLFNPSANGVDFVELYNNSEKIINLQNMKLGRQVNDSTREYKQIDQFYILSPKQYVAISTDSNATKEAYPDAQNLMQISSLPAMNNDQGIVLLATEQELILDSVPFSEKQHFELLNNVDGVSLERISFSQKGYNMSNWHSASASSGYATPGYQNSQFVDLAQPNANFTLQSKTISPDADGYEDALLLSYEVDNVGYTLNVYIFDLSGKMVHHAINNETLSTSGIVSWDGINSNGEKVPIGNYILLAVAFNLDGKVIKKKMAFSIVGIF